MTLYYENYLYIKIPLVGTTEDVVSCYTCPNHGISSTE